ncbi:MAG: hypothetical protein EON54_05825 [Alcaligenaceae bacterium]|nr:MAG: hypothetical protein EON54_05825 [Alcaligenaceae bacterium]
MKDDRKRQAVKSNYVEALGLATYCFSSLEWQVVWCCEKIKPGTLNKIVGKEMTAGTIATTFSNLARNMPSSPAREELVKLGEEFFRLKDVRNDIVHGKPCSGPNDESRLCGSKVIEINDLEDAADSFAACGIELNALSYGFLATYKPSSSDRPTTPHD